MSGTRRACALLSMALTAGNWSVLHAEAPAAAPQVQVGDTWKYRNVDGFTREPQSEYSHTVVDVNEREITTELRNSKSDKTALRYYNRDWNPVDVGDTKFEPYYPEFRFPLVTGMSWSDKYTLSTTSGEAATGFVNAKVPAFEKVSVAAGSFDAYRIERDIEVRNSNANALATQTHIIEWYAPSAKRYVRREVTVTRDGRVRSKTAEELIDYKLGGAAAAPGR